MKFIDVGYINAVQISIDGLLEMVLSEHRCLESMSVNAED